MREFDITLFEFDRTVKCVCGHKVDLQHKVLSEEELFAMKNEETRMREIKRCADKIAYLIVSTDYPLIDIEIEKGKFRERIHELFPDKGHLFDLIYKPRFRRLEEQFRPDQ